MGLLESAYQQCLNYEGSYELKNAGIFTELENKLVIEIKTVETLTDVHTAQILTYLRLGNHKLGLLINFHVKLLKQGIKRLIN